jgi:hypothetical protein
MITVDPFLAFGVLLAGIGIGILVSAFGIRWREAWSEVSAIWHWRVLHRIGRWYGETERWTDLTNRGMIGVRCRTCKRLVGVHPSSAWTRQRKEQ